MTSFGPADQLHRLVKYALDSGDASSLEEAQALFQGYRLALSIGSVEAACPLNQAALLTAVALGRRVFLGGVTVKGDIDTPLVIPFTLGDTLGDAVTALGGIVGAAKGTSPVIVIGGGPQRFREGFCIRTAVAGWRGGILPIHSELVPAEGPAMPLAAMLAAALAINEAFLFVNGGMPSAGHRTLGLSLWRPNNQYDWLADDDSEPNLTYLPSHLWMIGLGHLGQAYLWGLGLLPYASPHELSLVLQDVDAITPSTESTSILTDSTMVTIKKARAMADWAERRGFNAAIHERLFDADFKRQPEEPAVALCGLDNALGRRALDKVGFDLVVEAGLGRGYRDFRTMRLHLLPGSREAAEIWKLTEAPEAIVDRVAYKRMLDTGELDRCGVTLLAGKAVGAPFVGAVASTLALSEVLRLLHGGAIHQLIDLDLIAVEHRLTVLNPRSFQALNPGYTLGKN